MKKTRLDPEQLAVETFPTAPEVEKLAGTVHAAEASRNTQCATCDGASCGTSCGGGPPYCTCYPFP